VAKGTPVDLSDWRRETAQNSFAGTTVESIVLEISHQHPQLRPGVRTGIWCATETRHRLRRVAADQPGRSS
jgi:hypothetical protein